MKSGDGSFRHAQPTQAIRPVLALSRADAPARPNEPAPSKRAQRRFEAAEERRRKRKERKLARKP